MDEVFRLRGFRVSAVAARATQAQAALALDQAISRRRQRPPRPMVVLIAFVVAALLATAAYALYHDVIVGSPAPVSVQKTERRPSELERELVQLGIKTHINAGIEIAKTRDAGAISTQNGSLYLWVAPDTLGRDCSWLQVVETNNLPNGRPQLSGGCAADGSRVILNVQYALVKGQALGFVCCYVGTQGAKTVELRFTNGTSLTAQVYDKHVLVKTDPHNTVEETIVRAADGRVLDESYPPQPISPPLLQFGAPLPHTPSPRTGPWHTVASLRVIGSDRFATELTAPTRFRGDICYQFRLPTGGGDGSCGVRPPSATAIHVRPFHPGLPSDGLFLFGPVGREIRSLELTFEDGTHLPIGIHHGYVLYEVNPRNDASGHRPVRLIARDANNHVVGTRKYDFWP
jgi:hypothetical protein